jgi:hypothetical protein
VPHAYRTKAHGGFPGSVGAQSGHGTSPACKVLKDCNRSLSIVYVCKPILSSQTVVIFHGYPIL